jgi:hypothetical protein
VNYLSYEIYVSGFGGTAVPEEEFDYLANAASAIVDLLVSRPLTAITDRIRLAVAYEVELLYAQGGIDALAGLATVTSGINEKLGDYSIGTPYVANEKRCYSIGGIPVSGLTVAILRQEGLMARCVYTEGSL